MRSCFLVLVDRLGDGPDGVSISLVMMAIYCERLDGSHRAV